MKLLTHFSRIFVGMLFVVSGCIKLNDPIGFSFKLEEYFGADVLNLQFLIPFALSVSIFVVVFEIVLGIMLLFGFKSRFTVWCLLIMILFFTFLTFYSAYFNKVTDCGCFGDALKLEPWETFMKDIVLLIFILILFFYQKFIKPFFKSNILNGIIIVSIITCFAFSYYVLKHLPIIDFRPYKIGKNIQKEMAVPENAAKAVYQYTWNFMVNGKEEKIVNTGNYPEISNGKFLSVNTKEVKKGYEPPIHDFSIEKEGNDYTDAMLDESKLLMIVIYDLCKANTKGLAKLEKLNDKAKAKGYKVIAVTGSSENEIFEMKSKNKFSFHFYFCDETTLKTIIRSNPGILILNKGTVVQKVHYNDINKLKL